LGNILRNNNIRELIVVADDYGVTREVSEGIIHCYKKGIVTCASLMVNMPAFSFAAESARENKGLDIGLHLNLTWGRPVSSQNKVATLVNREGYFWGSSLNLLKRYCTGRIRLDEVEKEITAQIDRFQKTGFPLNYLNAHQYFSCIPAFFKIIVKVAVKRHISIVSLPDEIQSSGFFNLLKGKHIRALLVSTLAHFCSRYLKNPLIIADYFAGLSQTGKLSYSKLEYILRHLKAGTTELITHAGYNSKELETFSRITEARNEEVEILTSNKVRRLIKNLNIKLIDYKSLLNKKNKEVE